MTTQPADDDSYPDAWKPRHIKEREQKEARQREEFELAVAALTPEELQQIRGDR